MNLERRWATTWAALHLPRPGDAVLDAVRAAWDGPGRAYHNLSHLKDCFRRFDQAGHIARRPGEVLAALWFHDAIYQPRRSDNEERSARWAEKVLHKAGARLSSVARVAGLILATKHTVTPRAADARLIVDIDLSILGAAPERFRRYEQAIRSEYAWVPRPVFRRTRGEILKRFLARPAIYSTRPFIERFEARARSNLRRSIANLERTWRG